MAVVGEFFTNLFSQVWRVLELNMPVFNIPIWSVWVGIFLIELSIKIFNSFDISSPFRSNTKGRYPRKGDENA